MIYLDNNATTPLDERVLNEMLPFLKDGFGNASSTHQFGITLHKAVERARKQVATLIGANEKEITFTSGSTEGINYLFKGLAFNPDNHKKHIVTVTTEHKAVLNTCQYLESIGFEVTYLPVDQNGMLDLDDVKNSLREDTLLLSVMWVNNETGIIQPIREIGQIAHEAGVLFMSDATQVVGKLPIHVIEDNIDFLVLSGHKLYGPKGIGAVYINQNSINAHSLIPLLHGGDQESGIRSGTLNTPAIVGLGKACELAMEEMTQNQTYINELHDYLEAALLKIDKNVIHGFNALRMYNTTNVYIPGLEAEVFLGINKDIAISNGSACNSSLIQPSHVLLAMGLNNDEAMSSIRVSLGKENSIEDIDILTNGILNFKAMK